MYWYKIPTTHGMIALQMQAKKESLDRRKAYARRVAAANTEARRRVCFGSCHLVAHRYCPSRSDNCTPDVLHKRCSIKRLRRHPALTTTLTAPLMIVRTVRVKKLRVPNVLPHNPPPTQDLRTPPTRNLVPRHSKTLTIRLQRSRCASSTGTFSYVCERIRKNLVRLAYCTARVYMATDLC